jgi:hypothetical protein
MRLKMSDQHPNIYNEFDLEAARKAGQADEQERILKLIDKWRKDTNWTRTHFEYSKALSEVESLIKGEPIID